MLDTKFENEPYSAWFMFVGAIMLFIIAWSSVIRLTIKTVNGD